MLLSTRFTVESWHFKPFTNARREHVLLSPLTTSVSSNEVKPQAAHGVTASNKNGWIAVPPQTLQRNLFEAAPPA